MKKIVLVLSTLVLLSVSSCMSLTPLSKASIGDKCYLNVEIFQAFNDHEALAQGFNNNSIVVKLITTEDTFYDGKMMRGEYFMVDTYTYENKLKSIKTVPVFIKVSEYNAPKPLQEKKPEGQKL